VQKSRSAGMTDDEIRSTLEIILMGDI